VFNSIDYCLCVLCVKLGVLCGKKITAKDAKVVAKYAKLKPRASVGIRLADKFQTMHYVTAKNLTQGLFWA
jgi:hypothetical protein